MTIVSFLGKLTSSLGPKRASRKGTRSSKKLRTRRARIKKKPRTSKKLSMTT